MPVENLKTFPRGARDEVFEGLAAYRFCLEVICGLRSPLIGETEVLGQFKVACQAFELKPSPWSASFRSFVRRVSEDAKQIRKAHLDGLGSQSYGSVVRRELKGCSRVHLLGAGRLVEEMLPWLAKDGVDLRVHARDEEKARRSLSAIAPKAVVSEIEAAEDIGQAEALVIAAPLATAEIQAWLEGRANKLRLIIDLRSDSSLSPLHVQDRVRRLTLPDVFASVDANLERVQDRKRQALSAIEDLALARARHVEYRPFGWEDVCA